MSITVCTLIMPLFSVTRWKPLSLLSGAVCCPTEVSLVSWDKSIHQYVGTNKLVNLYDEGRFARTPMSSVFVCVIVDIFTDYPCIIQIGHN